MSKIQDFSGQNLSNLVWAYACVDLVQYPMLAAVSRQPQAILFELDPQSLANTAWAFAAIELRELPLLDAIAQQALRSMHAAADGNGNIWTPQELSTPAWSYGRLGLLHMPLLSATACWTDAQLAEVHF